jgi:hypothetical protein
VWNCVFPQADNPCKCLPVLIQYPEPLSFYRLVCCCEIYACPTHFGCSNEDRGIWRILELELHFCPIIIAHFWIQIENIQMIHKNFVSHHFKWQTWPSREQNSTAWWGGGAGGKALLLYSGSCRSSLFDAGPSSGSESSAGSFTSIGRIVSLRHQQIRECTPVSNSHSLYHSPETSFRSLVSPNINTKYASRHLGTLHATHRPCEVYLSTRVFLSSANCILVTGSLQQCLRGCGVST